MLLNLLIGSILLGAVHAAIPNHWLPVALIGRSEGWTMRETLGVAALSGFFHTLSTVILGVLIGAIGVELSEQLESQTRWIASLILIFMGLVYFAVHNPHSAHEHVPKGLSGRSKRAIIGTLAVAMLLSPCLEIETFFFTAGTLGWSAVATLSIAYTTVTILCMVGLTALSFKGLAHLQWHWLEHHEKQITGGILIALGILNFFIEL
jgi:nickel/cobalt exporter